MSLQLCIAAVLLAFPASIAGFTFLNQQSPCGAGQQCVPSSDCPEFNHFSAVLRGRPGICGFSGLQPRVCCDVAPPERPHTPQFPEIPELPDLFPTKFPSLPDLLPTKFPPLPDLFPTEFPPQPDLKPTEFPPQPDLKPTEFPPLPELPPPPPDCTELTCPTEFPPPPDVLPPTGIPEGEPNSATHPRLPTNCGKPSFVSLYPPYQEAFFVSGGNDADLSKWPWMVVFGRWTNGRLGNWFCGGTLITARHVLSAAHCFRPEETATIGARMGDARLSSNDTFEVQNRRIESITPHPGYTGGQHDLAVVRLAKEVELSHTARPICLPPPGSEFIGKDVEVAGRGLLEFGGQPADRLQEAPLRVTDPVACEKTFNQVPLFDTRFPNGFQNTVVCANSRTGGNQDACRGDSGGPLTIKLPAEVSSTYQLVGVVSGGFGCGNPEFPGVYMKVSSYIDWITQQLN